MKDITLKLPKIGLNQLDELYYSQGNQKVRLDEIANIHIGNAPREINRRNQARIGKVTAHIASDRAFDHIVHDIEEKLATIELPPDYQFEITGELYQLVMIPPPLNAAVLSLITQFVIIGLEPGSCRLIPPAL